MGHIRLKTPFFEIGRLSGWLLFTTALWGHEGDGVTETNLLGWRINDTDDTGRVISIVFFFFLFQFGWRK